MPFTQQRLLAGGLPLISVPMRGNKLASVHLIVRAGSRDETPQTAGLAHYLEHMYFKGTKSRPTNKEISWELAALGAETNAWTDTEMVCYYITGPAENVQPMAEILLDMLANSLFESKSIKQERGIILQEIADRSIDPVAWADDVEMEVAFGGDQPMAWAPSGNPQIIRTAKPQQILDYRGSFYSLDRMALVVAGGGILDPSRLTPYLSSIPTSLHHLPRIASSWGQGSRQYAFKELPTDEGDEPQVNLRLILPGISFTDPRQEAQEVLSAVLGSKMWSRLFQRLRVQQNLCYEVNTSRISFSDNGLFNIFVGTRPEDLPQAMATIVSELHSLANHGPSDQEMLMAKANLTTDTHRLYETAGIRGEQVAMRWATGLPLLPPEEQVARIKAITKSAVRDLAAQMVSDLPRSRAVLYGCQDMGDQVLEIAHQQRAKAGISL